MAATEAIAKTDVTVMLDKRERTTIALIICSVVKLISAFDCLHGDHRKHERHQDRYGTG